MILSDRNISARIADDMYVSQRGHQVFEELEDPHFFKLTIDPYHAEKMIFPETGMSYGLSCAGYDVRIAQEIVLEPGQFSLASTVEWFKIPTDIAAELLDKSSWAREGLSVFNTILEPGWYGYLTLELKNQHHRKTIEIPAGAPIGQLVFKQMTGHALKPYSGKYQGQPDRPVEAIKE